MKQHSSMKQMKKEVIISSILFAVSIITGLILFTIGLTLIGVLCFGYAAIIGWLSIITIIKIQGVHTRMLILKINGKNWKEFCECEKCKGERNA